MVDEDRKLYEGVEKVSKGLVDRLRAIKNDGYKQGLKEAKRAKKLKAIVFGLKHYNDLIFLAFGETTNEDDYVNNIFLQGKSVGFMVGLLDHHLRVVFSNEDVLLLYGTLFNKIKNQPGLSNGYKFLADKIKSLSETDDMFVNQKLTVFKQRRL